MLTKLRNIYLMKHGFYGDDQVVTEKDYMCLSDEEKEFADVRVEGDNYIIKTPKKVTDEEMREIINIQTSKDISDIKGYISEIKFIVSFCFISSIILGVVAAVLIFS